MDPPEWGSDDALFRHPLPPPPGWIAETGGLDLPGEHGRGLAVSDLAAGDDVCGARVRLLAVARLLEEWHAAHPGEDGIFGHTPSTMMQYLHRELKAAGVDWQPHDLRRAAVDQLYRAGVDPGAAAALVGHSPTTALRHYRRASEEDLQAAVARTGLGHVPAGEVILFRRKGS